MDEGLLILLTIGHFVVLLLILVDDDDDHDDDVLMSLFNPYSPDTTSWTKEGEFFQPLQSLIAWYD